MLIITLSIVFSDNSNETDFKPNYIEIIDKNNNNVNKATTNTNYTFRIGIGNLGSLDGYANITLYKNNSGTLQLLGIKTNVFIEDEYENIYFENISTNTSGENHFVVNVSNSNDVNISNNIGTFNRDFYLNEIDFIFIPNYFQIRNENNIYVFTPIINTNYTFQHIFSNLGDLNDYANITLYKNNSGTLELLGTKTNVFIENNYKTIYFENISINITGENNFVVNVSNPNDVNISNNIGTFNIYFYPNEIDLYTSGEYIQIYNKNGNYVNNPTINTNYTFETRIRKLGGLDSYANITLYKNNSGTLELLRTKTNIFIVSCCKTIYFENISINTTGENNFVVNVSNPNDVNISNNIRNFNKYFYSNEIDFYPNEIKIINENNNYVNKLTINTNYTFQTFINNLGGLNGYANITLYKNNSGTLELLGTKTNVFIGNGFGNIYFENISTNTLGENYFVVNVSNPNDVNISNNIRTFNEYFDPNEIDFYPNGIVIINENGNYVFNPAINTNYTFKTYIRNLGGLNGYANITLYKNNSGTLELLGTKTNVFIGNNYRNIYLENIYFENISTNTTGENNFVVNVSNSNDVNISNNIKNFIEYFHPNEIDFIPNYIEIKNENNNYVNNPIINTNYTFKTDIRNLGGLNGYANITLYKNNSGTLELLGTKTNVFIENGYGYAYFEDTYFENISINTTGENNFVVNVSNSNDVNISNNIRNFNKYFYSNEIDFYPNEIQIINENNNVNYPTINTNYTFKTNIRNLDILDGYANITLYKNNSGTLQLLGIKTNVFIEDGYGYAYFENISTNTSGENYFVVNVSNPNDVNISNNIRTFNEYFYSNEIDFIPDYISIKDKNNNYVKNPIINTNYTFRIGIGNLGILDGYANITLYKNNSGTLQLLGTKTNVFIESNSRNYVYFENISTNTSGENNFIVNVPNPNDINISNNIRNFIEYFYLNEIDFIPNYIEITNENGNYINKPIINTNYTFETFINNLGGLDGYANITLYKNNSGTLELLGTKTNIFIENDYEPIYFENISTNTKGKNNFVVNVSNPNDVNISNNIRNFDKYFYLNEIDFIPNYIEIRNENEDYVNNPLINTNYTFRTNISNLGGIDDYVNITLYKNNSGTLELMGTKTNVFFDNCCETIYFENILTNTSGENYFVVNVSNPNDVNISNNIRNFNKYFYSNKIDFKPNEIQIINENNNYVNNSLTNTNYTFKTHIRNLDILDGYANITLYKNNSGTLELLGNKTNVFIENRYGYIIFENISINTTGENYFVVNVSNPNDINISNNIRNFNKYFYSNKIDFKPNEIQIINENNNYVNNSITNTNYTFKTNIQILEGLDGYANITLYKNNSGTLELLGTKTNVFIKDDYKSIHFENISINTTGENYFVVNVSNPNDINISNNIIIFNKYFYSNEIDFYPNEIQIINENNNNVNNSLTNTKYTFKTNIRNLESFGFANITLYKNNSGTLELLGTKTNVFIKDDYKSIYFQNISTNTKGENYFILNVSNPNDVNISNNIINFNKYFYSNEIDFIPNYFEIRNENNSVNNPLINTNYTFITHIGNLGDLNGFANITLYKNKSGTLELLGTKTNVFIKDDYKSIYFQNISTNTTGENYFVVNVSNPNDVNISNNIRTFIEYLEYDFKDKFNFRFNKTEKLNLSKTDYKGKKKIFIENKLNKTIIEFEHNFSMENLNLFFFQIEENKTEENKSYIIINGLELQDNITKTIYLNKTSNSDYVCIKDEEISEISEISESCIGSNEYIIKCDGILNNNYSCILENNLYKIMGLKNSAALEFDAPPTPITTTTTGGGGGGKNTGQTNSETNNSQIPVNNSQTNNSFIENVFPDTINQTNNQTNNSLNNPNKNITNKTNYIIIFSGVLVLIIIISIGIYYINKKKTTKKKKIVKKKL